MYYYILHRLFVPLAEIVQNSCSKHGDMHGYVLVSPNVWRLQLRFGRHWHRRTCVLEFYRTSVLKIQKLKITNQFHLCCLSQNNSTSPLRKSDVKNFEGYTSGENDKMLPEFGRVTIITIPYPQIICSMYRMIYIQCPTVGKVHLSVYRAIVSW